MGRTNYASLSTEKVNARSKGLDRLAPLGIVRLMNRQDRSVLHAIQKAEVSLARAITLLTQRFRSGGRLFFVGAGTSGRLGVIEAAECPPTFGTPPSLIQAVMAGGKSAVFRSKEGSEDSIADGELAVRRLRVCRKDVVLGIAASGVTPFVGAALNAARASHAKTILLTCNPAVKKSIADIVIALRTGPEVLAGSTRLKAGSACKMALNILTTATMVQLGKVYGNRMVDLQPKSQKLVERGIRLTQELGLVNRKEAEKLFRAAHGQAKVAIAMARKKLTYTDAVQRLKEANGYLRGVL